MIRTRFAPSPTGLLHIGGMRTILYSYALAKRHNGKFLVRIEDTDQTRSKDEFIDYIYKCLDSYGIEEDESTRKGGNYGPYKQSDRKELYLEHAIRMVKNGYAYFCFLNKEETKQLQDDFIKENKRFRSPYRDIKYEEIEDKLKSNEAYTIRLKVPDDRLFVYEDGVQGKITSHSNEIDDQVLIKQDGFPTYHMAVAVDDHLMKITDVLRGFEYVTSIGKTILIYEGLGFEMPKHYHLSLILDPEGGKLSKRKGATSSLEFIEEGYIPSALINFLILLGWSSPLEREYGEKERELFSLNEFVEIFDTKNLNKSNPVFDIKKLDWFNKQYISKMDVSELLKNFVSWVEKYKPDDKLTRFILSDTNLEKKLSLVKERCTTLFDILNSLYCFYLAPENIDWDIKQLQNVRDVIYPIQVKTEEFILLELGDDSKSWTHEEWEKGLRLLGDKFEVKHGDIFMILRVTLFGGPYSPPLFESMQLMGKDEVVKRLRKFVQGGPF